jgi:L,D-transpeptidase YbiS
MSDFRLVVNVQTQRADLFKYGAKIKSYSISTAANGLGSEEGSLKTPSGLLKVAEKIGDGAASGTVFKGRKATGEVWSASPSNALSQSTEDLILTRILWLEGVEESNANTHQRYIYLHGTNQESLLGQAVSHGCIRFSNKDIEELFDLVPVGTEVFIGG